MHLSYIEKFHEQNFFCFHCNCRTVVESLVDEPKGTLSVAEEEGGEFLQAVALAVGEVVGDELCTFNSEGSKAVALLGGAYEEGEGYFSEVETGDAGRLGNFCEFCAGTAV